MADEASLDLELLHEHAPCGFVTTGSDGLFARVNDTFCELVGLERGELVGVRGLRDLLPVGGRIYLETHVHPLLEMSGRASEIALDLVRSDGERLPVLVSSVAERGPSDRVVGVHSVVLDVRERRSYEQQLVAERERAREAEAHARDLVRSLQRTLVPPVPPEIPDLLLASAYRPAGDGTEVGGDFFDVFEVADQEWVVVVGDVRGKGVEAAVLTSLIRHTLRAACMCFRRPSQALAELNRALIDASSPRFCTAVLVRLRREDDRWAATVCSAGHPLPLHTGVHGDVQEVGEAGTLLGVMNQPSLTDTTVTLQPGEGLLLYTDGTTEARRPEGFYDIERLLEVAGRAFDGPEDLVARLLADLVDFQSGQPVDDIVLVAMEVPIILA